MTDGAAVAVTAEQVAKHERSHAEAELYDNPGARTVKGCDPVGYVVACRTTYSGDSDHWVMDSLGMWPSREEAETDKADSLLDNAFDDNERLFVCAVVPIEDGKDV